MSNISTTPEPGLLEVAEIAIGISDSYIAISATSRSPGSGVVEIFDIPSGQFLRTIDNPNTFGTNENDRFGYSVSLSGNYLAVGAYEEDSSSANTTGAAYVFDVTDGSLLHTLTSDTPSLHFGKSVSISGNYLAVGDYLDTLYKGVVYVYDVTDGSLSFTASNPTPADYDFMGMTVSLSGGKLIASAKSNPAEAHVWEAAETSSGGSGFQGLQVMTDEEIQYTLGQRIQTLRATAGNIGSYQFRSSAQGAPTDPGTWKAVGTALNTKKDVADQSYTRTRASTYTTPRTSTYSRTRVSSYSRISTRLSTVNYAGDFTGNYTRNFEGNYARGFSGQYTGTYTAYYTGDYVGNYARGFGGNYVGNYARNVTDAYTGNYARGFSGQYVGTLPRNVTDSYVGNYSRGYVGEYAGTYSRNITDSYVGNYTRGYVGEYAGTYSRNITDSYTGNYTNTFVGDFVGNYARGFVGEYTGTYSPAKSLE
jgi:hypothetical protein